jgi:DNA-binding transcriptional ArsR family regulator
MPERAERYGLAGDALGALGDPSRRAIADALPISRPAVSRHLRVLKSARLVTEEPAGTRRIYRLHDEGLGAVRSYLQGVWGDAAVRFGLAAENTRPRR